MVRDTHLPAVVVYSGRQDLPFNARTLQNINLARYERNRFERLDSSSVSMSGGCCKQ